MKKYSAVMQVLWRLAVQEALAVRHEFVESEHVLEVITSRLLLEGALNKASGVTCVAEQGQVVLKTQ